MSSMSKVVIKSQPKPSIESSLNQRDESEVERLSQTLSQSVRQVYALGEQPLQVTQMEAYGVVFQLTQLSCCLEMLLARLAELHQENHGFNHAVRSMSLRTDWSTGHNKQAQLSLFQDI